MKDCIGQNVLENLLKNDLMAIIARFFLFFQMGTVFPLLIFIFRVQCLYIIFKIQEYPGFLHVLGLNAITVTVCTIVSITYPQVFTLYTILCAFLIIVALSTFHNGSFHDGNFHNMTFHDETSYNRHNYRKRTIYCI